MRIGRFYVSSQFTRERHEEVADILSLLRFVLFRVEYLYRSSRFLMEGMSEKFAEVEENQVAPFYDLEITKLNNKLVEVMAVKSNSQF